MELSVSAHSSPELFSILFSKPDEFTLTGLKDRHKVFDNAVRVSLVGPAKRLFIQTGDTLVIAPQPFGHILTPSFVFVTPSSPELCDTIAFPWPLDTVATSFTHALAADKLTDISQAPPSSQITLFPAISPQSVSILNFALDKPGKVTVEMLDGQSLYAFTLDNATAFSFGFDPHSRTAFVRSGDSPIVPASVTKFPSYVLRVTAADGSVSFKGEQVGEPVEAGPPAVAKVVVRGARPLGQLPSVPSLASLFPARRRMPPVLRVPALRTPAFAKGVLEPDAPEPFLEPGQPPAAWTPAIRSIVDRAPFPAQAIAAARYDTTAEAWLRRQDWSPGALPVADGLAIGRAFLAIDRIRRGGVGDVGEIEDNASKVARADALEGAVVLEVAELFGEIRQSNAALFERLVDRALAILRAPRIGRPIPAASAGFSEYECGDVDAVWIGVDPEVPHRVAVFAGRDPAVALKAGQLTVTGGYFQLKGLDVDTCVDIIPIRLSDNGIGFAVQLVNYLLNAAPSDDSGRPFIDRIVFELFDDIQKERFLLLTSLTAHWFTQVLEAQLVSPDVLPRFFSAISLDSLRTIADPRLATAVTLFSAYIYGSASRIVEFVDTVTDFSNVYASSIASQIAFELVNPLDNRLSLLGPVSTLPRPIPTRFSLAAAGDPSSLSSSYASLSSLTPRQDSLLLAAALTLRFLNAPPPDDSVLAQLLPDLPPSAARFRLSLHSSLAAAPAWFLPHFALSGWLSPLASAHARFAVDTPLDLLEPADLASDRALFAKLAAALAVAPLDAGPYFNRAPDGDRLSRVLRRTAPSLFEPGALGRLLPRGDAAAAAELGAFAGVGRWLSWLWRTGKAIPIPLSRVVIRAAFGGRLRADDFADVDAEFAAQERSGREIEERIAPFRAQLTAVRAGAALSGLTVEAEIAPRLFQLRPFTLVREDSAVPPALAPLVREEDWTPEAKKARAAQAAARTEGAKPDDEESHEEEAPQAAREGDEEEQVCLPM